MGKTPEIVQITLDPGVLYAFTDGSCYPNPGPGGWACLLVWNGKEKEAYGGAPGQTNNSMELTAINEALKLRTRDVKTIVVSDNQYCVNALTAWWRRWKRNNWMTAQGTPVQNRELIEEIVGRITVNTRFLWTKGHAGHEFNERVDVLAGQGRELYGGK